MSSCKACGWKYIWHLLELLTLVLSNPCWEPVVWLHLLVRRYLVPRSKACRLDVWLCPVTGHCCRGLRDPYLVSSGLVSSSVLSGLVGGLFMHLSPEILPQLRWRHCRSQRLLRCSLGSLPVFSMCLNARPTTSAGLFTFASCQGAHVSGSDNTGQAQLGAHLVPP